MERTMKLHERPFENIQSGKKRVELRLYDEKRRNIQVGDTILFLQPERGETLRKRVADIRVFPDFFELYEHFDKVDIGYEKGEVANAEDMYEYYSPEEIAKYGVVAIVLE